MSSRMNDDNDKNIEEMRDYTQSLPMSLPNSLNRQSSSLEHSQLASRPSNTKMTGYVERNDHVHNTSGLNNSKSDTESLYKQSRIQPSYAVRYTGGWSQGSDSYEAKAPSKVLHNSTSCPRHASMARKAEVTTQQHKPYDRWVAEAISDGGVVALGEDLLTSVECSCAPLLEL